MLPTNPVQGIPSHLEAESLGPANSEAPPAQQSTATTATTPTPPVAAAPQPAIQQAAPAPVAPSQPQNLFQVREVLIHVFNV